MTIDNNTTRNLELLAEMSHGKCPGIGYYFCDFVNMPQPIPGSLARPNFHAAPQGELSRESKCSNPSYQSSVRDPRAGSIRCAAQITTGKILKIKGRMAKWRNRIAGRTKS
jgi:hypothetical protein